MNRGRIAREICGGVALFSTSVVGFGFAAHGAAELALEQLPQAHKNPIDVIPDEQALGLLDISGGIAITGLSMWALGQSGCRFEE